MLYFFSWIFLICPHFFFLFCILNYKPSSFAGKPSPRPVVQNVTSDILVLEVMKLIWWSVGDMANKQSSYWSWSTGSSAPPCVAEWRTTSCATGHWCSSKAWVIHVTVECKWRVWKHLFFTINSVHTLVSFCLQCKDNTIRYTVCLSDVSFKHECVWGFCFLWSYQYILNEKNNQASCLTEVQVYGFM